MSDEADLIRSTNLFARTDSVDIDPIDLGNLLAELNYAVQELPAPSGWPYKVKWVGDILEKSLPDIDPKYNSLAYELFAEIRFAVEALSTRLYVDGCLLSIITDMKSIVSVDISDLDPSKLYLLAYDAVSAMSSPDISDSAKVDLLTIKITFRA